MADNTIHGLGTEGRTSRRVELSTLEVIKMFQFHMNFTICYPALFVASPRPCDSKPFLLPLWPAHSLKITAAAEHVKRPSLLSLTLPSSFLHAIEWRQSKKEALSWIKRFASTSFSPRSSVKPQKKAKRRKTSRHEICLDVFILIETKLSSYLTLFLFEHSRI